jgi:hypothetical protein
MTLLSEQGAGLAGPSSDERRSPSEWRTRNRRLMIIPDYFAARSSRNWPIVREGISLAWPQQSTRNVCVSPGKGIRRFFPEAIFSRSHRDAIERSGRWILDRKRVDQSATTHFHLRISIWIASKMLSKRTSHRSAEYPSSKLC